MNALDVLQWALTIGSMTAAGALFVHGAEAQRILQLHRRISRVLASGEPVRVAGKQLLSVLCENGPFDAGVLFVADPNLQSLRAIASWRAENQVDEAFTRHADSVVLAIGSGLPGQAWLSGKTVLFDDLKHGCSPPELAAQCGLRSGLVVPMTCAGVVVAVCELLSRKPATRIIQEKAVYEAAVQRMGPLLYRELQLERARASETELRALIDTAADGIVWLDDRGKILCVNRAASRLIGYTESEMLGHEAIKFLPDQYQRPFGNALTQYFETAVQRLVGKVTEVGGLRKDGSVFPMELSVSRLSEGERDTYIAIVRDISERKMVEKRLSEFYSTVSHELRSPLASIRGSLGLIEGGAIGPVSPDVLELVQIGKRNCERLIRLVNDILDAKKIEAGKVEFNKRPLRPNEVVLAAVEEMNAFATESEVALVAAATDSCSVVADADRLVQVLTNLLSNAVKYSPPGSSVDVFTTDAINGKDFLRFCVRDRGPGLDSKQLEKLFSEFQQLDGSDSRPKGGTGLGLAISKRIIEELNGQIGVENSPGKGATFWFELPLSKDHGST